MQAAEADPVYNLAYLPLRFRMRDAYGCTDNVGRHVSLTTEPRCIGLHGIASAAPDARGVVSFDPKLQLQLSPELLEKRIKLIFTAKPADGEPPLQAVAWLYVLPSGKPASLELAGPASLRRATGGGSRSASTEERCLPARAACIPCTVNPLCVYSPRYELAGPARAVVTGLTLRPKDEAGTRL